MSTIASCPVGLVGLSPAMGLDGLCDDTDVRACLGHVGNHVDGPDLIQVMAGRKHQDLVVGTSSRVSTKMCCTSYVDSRDATAESYPYVFHAKHSPSIKHGEEMSRGLSMEHKSSRRSSPPAYLFARIKASRSKARGKAFTRVMVLQLLVNGEGRRG